MAELLAFDGRNEFLMPPMTVGGGTSSAPTIRMIDDWHEFEALDQAWDELANSVDGGPFVTHGGLRAWWRAYGQGIQPCILTVWRDGLLVGGVPLGIAEVPLSPRLPFLKIKRLQLLSNERVGFSRWLIAPGHEDVVALLLRAMVRQTAKWDLAVFEPVTQSPLLDRIVEAASDLNLPLLVDTRFHSTATDLSGGWSAYISRRSRNFRKSVRIARERVEATNHVVLRETDGGAAVLERILALSSRSWKSKAGTAIGVDKPAATFMRHLWALLGPVNQMNLYLLQVDGKDISSIILLRQNKTVYAYLSDFDEQYQSLSPGRFIIAHAMEQCCREGSERFDMMRRTHFLEGFGDEHSLLMKLRMFPSRNCAYSVVKLEKSLRPIANATWNIIRGTRKRRQDIKATA